MLFNWLIFLWWLSLGISIYTFVYGLAGRSWLYMLICTITFIPVAYFLLSLENNLKYISLLNLLFAGLTFLFWWITRKPRQQSTTNQNTLEM